jgi:glycosyltransferase involved in cell wall biosynthesis
MVGNTTRMLAGLARRERADVLIGWMGKGQIYAGLAAVAARRPCVWLQASTPSRSSPIDRTATLLPARVVVTLSREVQRAQTTLHPRRQTKLVYPAVDTARFDAGRIGPPDAVRQRLGLPSDGPIFGSVGRLQRWKGFHVLLGAVPRVLEHHPDATFVLVGGPHELDPSYADELQKQARGLGMDGRVQLVGQQPNPEEWMQAMDVFVHTSHGEPFGMVIIEAMALGKPVVATAEAGPTEIITPGVNGLLAPYGDPGAVGDAIVRFLDDRDFRLSIAHAGRQRAQDFTVQRFARQFGDAVADAVRNTRGG